MTDLLVAFALGGIVAVAGLLVYVFVQWGRIADDVDEFED